MREGREDMNDVEFAREYMRLAHAIQSSIALAIARDGVDSAGTSPKHLRVGIDLQRRDQASIAELLVSKGLITREELNQTIIDGLQKELLFVQKIEGVTFG
jgi:hypothetical protein